MDSLLVAILAQAIGIIAIVCVIIGLLIFALSRRKQRSNGARTRAALMICVILSLVSVVLLASVVLVGHGFFNNPQFTDDGITETTWPYVVERIALLVSAIATIIVWVRYLRRV